MKHLPNINFLRYFYSAGKNRSMSKAAKENFVTQSAISQGIDKLEKEVGKKLLTNEKNRFVLTTEGELLLEKCETIFSYLSEIEDLFNEKEGIYRGKFTFAASHSFAISLLPLYYKRLFDTYPHVEPIVRLGHSGIVREWVKKGEVEFGIIQAKEEDYSTFRVIPILEGKQALYKAKGIPAQDRYIISEYSYEDKKLIDYLKKQGRTIPPLIEVLSWEVIAHMVEQGLGVGILPDYVARRHSLQPLRLPQPHLPYKIIAISSPRKPLSRNASLFIDLMST